MCLAAAPAGILIGGGTILFVSSIAMGGDTALSVAYIGGMSIIAGIGIGLYTLIFGLPLIALYKATANTRNAKHLVLHKKTLVSPNKTFNKFIFISEKNLKDNFSIKLPVTHKKNKRQKKIIEDVEPINFEVQLQLNDASEYDIVPAL